MAAAGQPMVAGAASDGSPGRLAAVVPARSPRSSPARRVRRLWRRISHGRRLRALRSDGALLVALTLASVGLCWAGTAWPRLFPESTLALVVLAGGLMLRRRSLLLLHVVVAATLAYAVVGRPSVGIGSVGVVVVTGAAVLVLSRTRTRLGVPGTSGETMLVDLRDRLRQQGEMPPLPAGWHAEIVLRPAGGDSFSGDFLVASRPGDGATLEVGLVDVSGKGRSAGTRALLLSGAFGGLLGSMAPGGFLQAANSYLLRQDWDEGFATAVHVVVDLASGEYVVRSAGHPPIAQFAAGSGRWRLRDAARGPALGVIPGATYLGETGRLGRGDALLLYTDGLVEVPGRDLSLGIDRLLGHAERLVTRGFRHGARTLIDSVASGRSDDRALVLIWRT
ncbi:MAG TPA: PP2C family protein-serine/threonine phosphatase [Actinomycetes bacterium]|nr:PP2C family protein-serine/threonine phosphatase [Actinomycetes bacterium]